MKNEHKRKSSDPKSDALSIRPHGHVYIDYELNFMS